MNLFEKYEELRKTKDYIPIGSVWSSGLHEWVVIQNMENDNLKIRVQSSMSNGAFPSYGFIGGVFIFNKYTFKMHFKRVK